MRMIALLIGCTAALLARPLRAAEADAPPAGKSRAYVGTYTTNGSRGLYRLELDAASGALAIDGPAAEVENPSFLAAHPGGRFLYAVNEVGTHQGKPGGAVTAFAVDRVSGTLKKLNDRSSGGVGPCHLSVDHRGKNVLVANYGGGSVAVLPIAADGRLGEATAFVQHEGSGPDKGRQEGPHAHWIAPDAAGRFAVAADLGLDKLLVYRFDADRGTLAANDPPSLQLAPGSGPRHVAFHPDGRHAYAINEMKSTVTALDYDPGRGTLAAIQTLPTLPADFRGESSTAEIAVHPSGRFLYGSNRGHDSIAAYAIEAGSGRLTPLGNQSTLGKTPRNFAIDPSGAFLLAANQDSNTVVAFRIDPQTGRLASTGQSVKVPVPVCVTFLPAGPGGAP